MWPFALSPDGMSDEFKKHDSPERHDGPARTSPYPVSRLSAPIDLVDVAREIQQADQALGNRANAKLRVIADQIKALQNEARGVLEETRRDQELHRARCNFKRQPGKIYHLYRRDDGEPYFSMLSPEDWSDAPPHEFLGSYRLEADMSWTPAERLDDPDETAEVVRRLLADNSTGAD